MINPFKVGDRVRCINPPKNTYIKLHQIYTVSARNKEYIGVDQEPETNWNYGRFEPAVLATPVQGVQPSNTWLDQQNCEGGIACHHDPMHPPKERQTNLGTSDYATHKIQPWDIWMEYNLNPWDADIVKRVLRKKTQTATLETDLRILDYKKIIHVCQERIRQLEE